MQLRTRRCDDPAPSNGGRNCELRGGANSDREARVCPALVTCTAGVSVVEGPLLHKLRQTFAIFHQPSNSHFGPCFRVRVDAVNVELNCLMLCVRSGGGLVRGRPVRLQLGRALLHAGRRRALRVRLQRRL